MLGILSEYKKGYYSLENELHNRDTFVFLETFVKYQFRTLYKSSSATVCSQNSVTDDPFSTYFFTCNSIVKSDCPPEMKQKAEEKIGILYKPTLVP